MAEGIPARLTAAEGRKFGFTLMSTISTMSPPADGVSSMDSVGRRPAASIRPVIGQPIPIFSSTSGLIDTE